MTTLCLQSKKFWNENEKETENGNENENVGAFNTHFEGK